MTAIVGPKKVVDCYSFLDAFASCGITDFTDGKYNGDPSVLYKQAQINQAEYLLDEIRCSAGSKILDIGCGNGRILEAAKKRGAEALGITISPEQVRKNNRRGLETVLMNYKNIPQEWNGRFDGIIANGSIEHFVQLDDAISGSGNRIYREMFGIMSRILKPRGRVATTVIHFRFRFDPREIKKGVRAFGRGSLNFHAARIEQDFGGWGPAEKQLIECAKPYFRNVKREDGTEDYHVTSEYWLQAAKKIMWSNPKAWFLFAGKLIRNPKGTIGFLDDLIVSQSWMNQFRDWHGQGTPTYLFRDTWEKMSGGIQDD